MTFISICIALYDYIPQGDNELAIQEGELIYVLEKSTEDDWWKAKKRAPGEEEEEPIGLIPNNYVQEATPTHHAKALYDYSRQTDEEVSFSEDARLDVFDTSDPDWTLVGLGGEYGFAPANYIDIIGEAAHQSPEPAVSPQHPGQETKPDPLPSPASPLGAPAGPAAALANVMHSQPSSQSPTTQKSRDSPPTNITLPRRRPQYTPEDSDEDEPTPPAPSLPQRPPSGQISPPPTQYASPRSPEPAGVMHSPPYNRVVSQSRGVEESQRSPGGFHLYNINEMVSAIGKKKKLPTTLGLNLATGTIMIAPEKSGDGPQQEWTAEKLTHYSIEGKHVFMELVRPSKSVDFHAGAKDTAQEIVAGLGEIAGAARAGGLREILEISEGGGGQKKGQVLYDFMAQGEDEVTVAVGDEVIVLDDQKSEEWWMVRRLKNGKEGVVPSSYVELAGKTAPPPNSSGLNAARATVDQNRLEEERLAIEAVRGTRKRGGSDPRSSEVGPGLKLPTRGSSLTSDLDGNTSSSQRSKRDNKPEKSSSKSKPDAKKTRTWTDRSGSFKVEAQFIGLKDGKIHLHKLNGVKIAVPVGKMAIEDLEYVEKVTGQSLDDDKPLSDIRRKSMQNAKDNAKRTQASSSQETRSPAAAPKTGASVEPSKQGQDQSKGPEYDWFDFFLKAGVNPYQCERYAFNFNKDSMDETVLPEINASVLRALGLKEGDILRVMKFLDIKFNRNKSKLRNVSYSGEGDEGDGPMSPSEAGGGLFSGPGGALRNNTRKGRPAPPVQTSDVVDAESLKQKSGEKMKTPPSDATSTPLASAPPPPRKNSSGFDDDAWDVKPSKQPTRNEQPAQKDVPEPAKAIPAPILTGSMAELSLLTPPLQPTPAPRPAAQQSQPPQQLQQTQQQQQPTQQAPFQQVMQPQASAGLQSQPTGASPAYFSQVSQQPTGAQNQQQSIPQAPLSSNYNSQPSFQNQVQQQQPQNMPPRQRPQAPQAQTPQQTSFLPPPPRPLSAPQNVSQNNNFGPPPLQPQLTGFQPSNNLPQLAPPGQSLNDMNQMRQQQFNQQQVYPQQTGFTQPSPGFGQFGGGIQPQPTGYGQQIQSSQQFQSPQQPTFQNPQQPFLNGQQTGSPFADPRMQQQTGGFQPQFQNSLQPQQTGSINSFLPPALQPQNTGVNGFGGRPGFGQPTPPLPPMPSQHTAAPLVPQKTGPAPPVRFGTQPATKLMPQPTGRKANLSQATPQNPFGF